MNIPEEIRQAALPASPEDTRSREQYEIVTKTAYLIGVPKKQFDNEKTSLDPVIFGSLDKNKAARIIRNLCILRCDTEKNFSKIVRKMEMEHRTLLSMPEFISMSALQQLSEDKVNIYSELKNPTALLIILNKTINSRINNCKDLFPAWLKWDYFRNLIIMPGGTDANELKALANVYYQNYMFYPYHMYVNWKAGDSENQGNILAYDKKFLTLLYSWNGDEFTDTNRVSDVSNRTKSEIYSFLKESGKAELLVDCENSDPYSLSSAINNLSQKMLDKLVKIILIDDVHTTNAWDIFGQFLHAPVKVEYVRVNRILENKSLVDQTLIATVYRLFYQDSVDSFILAASDSDYWSLIQNLPEARFLVMVEHEKCSEALKEALSSKNIFYCYIDEFYSGSNLEFKRRVLLNEVGTQVRRAIHINARDILEQAVKVTRVPMSKEELEAFYDKYLRTMELTVAADGQISLRLKK